MPLNATQLATWLAGTDPSVVIRTAADATLNLSMKIDADTTALPGIATQDAGQ